MHAARTQLLQNNCTDKSLEHSNKIAATILIIETAGCFFAFVLDCSSIWLIDY